MPHILVTYKARDITTSFQDIKYWNRSICLGPQQRTLVTHNQYATKVLMRFLNTIFSNTFLGSQKTC